MFTGSVGCVSRATLDKDPHEVASMFDAVARRYDLTNTVLSLGQDRFWRRATRSALRIGPGDKVLDLAAGTAVSTVELAASGAWCVAADFSVGMLAAGAGRRVPKVAGDATRLPFDDEVFDAVTISFGLRNVVDHSAGLREMARVTRPGGRLVVCEFSTPTNRLFATAYKEYLMQALPRMASAFSSNPDAYVYLAESIRAWPDQAQLAHRISDAGWSAVRWRNLSGGIVALHAATEAAALVDALNAGAGIRRQHDVAHALLRWGRGRFAGRRAHAGVEQFLARASGIGGRGGGSPRAAPAIAVAANTTSTGTSWILL